MTLILALLGKAWPAIAAVAGGLLAWGYVFINKKKADTAVAQEKEKTASAQADAAKAQASASATNEVAAQADKAAAEQALSSAKESQNVDKEFAAMPPGAAMQRLRDDGFVADDSGHAVPAAPATGSDGQNESH
jgi:hypothetical protein